MSRIAAVKESVIKRFVVWSNAFYLVPFALSVYADFWVDTAALGVLLICSTAFHASGERRFVLADILASALVIVVNAVACILGDFRTPYFTGVWLLAVVAFFIRYYVERGDRGSTAHGFWHVLAAAILSLCILVYTT
ncbi:hypothetical protein HY418_01570 [Candidatus Kaiserbacteria bacterium]|nr:hypothetical protein [Candidatus Kaiserbacteria bacterium]